MVEEVKNSHWIQKGDWGSSCPEDPDNFYVYCMVKFMYGVNKGQTCRSFCDCFRTLDEAKKAYPKASIGGGIVLTCGKLKAYNIYETRNEALRYLPKAIIASGGHPEDCKIMEFDEFLKLESNHLLGQPLKELKDEAEYMDYIEQLPPHRWFTYANIDFYDCLESYTGSYRTSWIKFNGRFFEMMIDDYENDETRVARFMKKLEVLQ